MPNADLTTDIAVGLSSHYRISSETLRLQVVNNQLLITPIRISDTVNEQLQNIACKIADYLPHTPVAFFGINFKVGVPSSDLTLENIFALPDVEKYQEHYPIKHTLYRHTIEVNDVKTNVDVSLEDRLTIFNVNYEFNINDLVDLKAKIAEHSIDKLQAETKRLITKIYLS